MIKCLIEETSTFFFLPMVTMLDNKILCFLVFISLIGGIFSEYNLTIVHIGDFHSHWFEFNEKEGKCSDQESVMGKCFGGFPRLLNFVRDIRRKEKNVVVLSSGEFFLGRSLNPLHGWKIANSLVPRLELDAMSLANHDFGDGMLELSAFLYAMNFPVVCANMWARETSFLYSRVNKSAIIDVNDERIGVVGYVHPDTLQKSKKVTSVKFTSEIPAIQDEVESLERKGINKIIALGHSGYYIDLEIARNVKGVDVVIGGNSDIVLEKTEDGNGKAITEGNIHGNYPRIHHHNDTDQLLPNHKSLVLHIPQHGKYVGLVKLTFDDDGRVIHESGEPVLLDSSIPQDMDTLYFLRKLSLTLEEINRHGLLPDYDEVLATVRQDLESGKCRVGECAVGNLVTDAMMDTYSTKQDTEESDGETEKWGQVDAVVFNSGSIRYPLQKGNITIRDLIHSFYVGDFMKRVPMSGKQLRQMMEHSVENFDPTGIAAPGTFLQVSGLRVTYDINKSPGNRVRKLSIRCRTCNGTFAEVKANKKYFVSMPNFITAGGDGYPVYETDDSAENVGQPEILLILEYLKKINEVTPMLDGRISFLNAYEPPNITNENREDISNPTTLQIQLSTTTSISSKDNLLSDLDKENKYSYMDLKQGHVSKEASPGVSTEEMPESLKLSLPKNSLNPSINMSEYIKHDFEKNVTRSFWSDFLLKPKHAVVARKSVEESNLPVVNETLMVNNNYTKSNVSTDEDHHVLPTENRAVPNAFKNSTSPYNVHIFKLKDLDLSTSSINNSKHRTERIVPASETLEFKNFLPKLEFVDDNSSFVVENNMETNISQNEIASREKPHDSLNETTSSSVNTKYENKSSAGKALDIENITSPKDSEVRYNPDFELKNAKSNIFEVVMWDVVNRNEAGSTYLLDDKLKLMEGNSKSILNNTLDGGLKVMSNFDVTANALDVNSEESNGREAMASVPSNLSLERQETSANGILGMQEGFTSFDATSAKLDVETKENKSKPMVEYIPHFLGRGSNKTKIQNSDGFSGIQVGDTSNISRTCDTCLRSVDEENKSLDRGNKTILRDNGESLTRSSSTLSGIQAEVTDENFKHANPGLLTNLKGTPTKNISFVSNLVEENVKSVNGTSENFVKEANKNVEIGNSLLVDSITDAVLKRISNNTIYSNLKNPEDPDVTNFESGGHIGNWTTGVVNQIRFNVLKAIEKDIEIEKNVLVESIANSIFESMEMNSDSRMVKVPNTSKNSNFVEDSSKKFTVTDQTLNYNVLNTTHELENPIPFRNLTDENVRSDTINDNPVSDANVNFKTSPTAPSSNSLNNGQEDTTKVLEDLTSTLTIESANNGRFNNNLTLYAEIQDDKNGGSYGEKEISWFPWFFSY